MAGKVSVYAVAIAAFVDEDSDGPGRPFAMR